MKDILAGMGQVAEGVATCSAAVALAKENHINVPIMQVVKDVIDDKLDVKDVVEKLMTLPLTGE